MTDVFCYLPSGVVPPRQLESFLVDSRGSIQARQNDTDKVGLHSEPDSGESICPTDFSKFLGCLI